MNAWNHLTERTPVPHGKGESPVSAKNPPALRILIVDDEPLIRWSLAETLVECGHSVAEAGDGNSALQAVSGEGRFDVVLLDYRLPDSNDLQLLAEIRHRAPASAVVMMTAFGTPEVTQAALDLGAYRVVPKPFEVQEMAELILQAHAAASIRFG
jgi:DNA-binding NtrC family response regulator